MIGKERVLVAVLLVLAFGTLISALSNSLALMLVGRVIQGAGGGIFPLAFGIIRDEFPREKTPGAIGLVSSLLGLGGGLGIVMAGVIVDSLSYHWLFWFPLVAIIGAAGLTVRYIPESRMRTPGSINWAAAALMSLGLAIVLIGVSQTTSWGWGSAKVWAMIVGGNLILAAWVRVEIGAREPLVDMTMMRIRGVWTTNLVAFLLGMGMYASFVIIPEFTEAPKSTGFGFGSSVTGAGLFLVPSTLAMVLIGPMAGRLERRFGSRTLLQVGTASALACFLILTFAHDAKWHFYVASGLLGFGIGLAFAALANLIVEAVKQAQTGVATGMNTVMRTLGGAFGGQLAATFISASIVGDNPTEHGYTQAFALCAGALALGVLAGFVIPGRTAAETAEAPGQPHPHHAAAAVAVESR